MKLFEAIANVFRIPDLRKRVLFTLALLAVYRIVPLKLLPFGSKDEFQIVIDMPRGTTLEQTDAASRDFGAYLAVVGFTPKKLELRLKKFCSPMAISTIAANRGFWQSGWVYRLKGRTAPMISGFAS